MLKVLVLLLLPCLTAGELTRDELMDYLRYKQEARTTFDSRVQQQIKPIGFVGDKPIWPRIVNKVSSPNEIFFDDDNFAYVVKNRNPATLVKHMDREENYKKVVAFLERYLA